MPQIDMSPLLNQKSVTDYMMQNQKFQQQQRAGEQEIGMNDEKIKAAKIGKAVKYLGMATPENWQSIRSQAIQEGLGSEQTLPMDYDDNWIQKTRAAFADTSQNVPSSIQNYSLYKTLNPDERELFDRSNRGITSNYLNTGGALVNPYNNTAIPITPKASEMPGFKADVTKATKTAENEADYASPDAVKTRTQAEGVKTSALDVTNRLLNNISGVKANRGGISTLIPNVTDSSVNAAADLETLASLLTTENLGLLKGVLSDTDMKVLKDIGAGGLKGADDQVLTNLQTIKQKLEGQVNPNLNTKIGGNNSGWTIEPVE